MRAHVWVSVAFGLIVTLPPADAAGGKSVEASLDLKALIGRTIVIGQPDAAPPFTFERLAIKFVAQPGGEDIEHALFERPAKSREFDPKDSKTWFGLDAKIVDSRNGRTEGNDASCRWTSAAKTEADCDFSEDGGGFKLLLRDSLPGVRPLAALAFGGKAGRSQVLIALFSNKKGEVDGVSLKIKGEAVVVVPLEWN